MSYINNQKKNSETTTCLLREWIWALLKLWFLSACEREKSTFGSQIFSTSLHWIPYPRWWPAKNLWQYNRSCYTTTQANNSSFPRLLWTYTSKWCPTNGLHQNRGTNTIMVIGWYVHHLKCEEKFVLKPLKRFSFWNFIEK